MRTATACFLLAVCAALPAQIRFAGPVTHPAVLHGFTAPVPGTLAIVVDLDGDGDQDIVSAQPNVCNSVVTGCPFLVAESPGGLAWCENQGDDTFLAAAAIGTAVFSNRGVVACDLERDGDMDFVSLGRQSGAGGLGAVLCILVRESTAFAIPTILPMPWWADRLLVLDGDGDGDPDFFIVGGTGSVWNAVLVTNDGTGTLTLGPTQGPLAPVQALVSGDVNKDGIDDVVLGEGSGQRVLLGTPSGLFTLGPLAPVSGAAATPRAFAPGDVNGDGHLDLVSAHPGPASSTVMLQLGDGTGAFPGTTAIPLPASSGTVVSLVLADLNGDEALDLVLGVDAMGGGHLIVQPNVLGSFVGPGMTLVTGSNPDGVALSSTAGTNHLVAASLAGGDVTIFRNITPQVVLTGPPVAGATFTLNLLAEDSGTLAYLSGFASTTVPGIPLSDGRTIPLTLDPLLFWCLDPVNTAITGGAGSLDATGGAEIHFSIPRISELRGLTMHAAFIVLDNGAPLGIHRISAPRPIVIQ